MPKFEVKLFQKEWINTEKFEFEADSKDDALAQAQKHVDEEKELGDKEYKFEAEQIVEAEVDNDGEAGTV
jgi:hypothetical protein